MKKFTIITVLFAVLLSAVSPASAQSIINTIAGNGTSAFSGDGGAAIAASLYSPYGIAVDAYGNKYICDAYNRRVRKVDAGGSITTIAGSGIGDDGGLAVDARLMDPVDAVVDAVGNLYIADVTAHGIRKISTSGIITTVAGNGWAGYSGDGGAATLAKISGPRAVIVDAAGNIYVCDSSNTVRRINTAGIISTVAGNGTAGFSGDGGPATAAQLNLPCGLMLMDGELYISDRDNNRIRKVNAAGIISTIAGTGVGGYTGDGGPAVAATLFGPAGLTSDGVNIYFCDGVNSAVRKIDITGTISTIAGGSGAGFSGDGGPALTAFFLGPVDIAWSSSNDLYVADVYNNRIRMFDVPRSISSDSFAVSYTTDCRSLSFSVLTAHYTTGRTIVAMFGDGSDTTATVLPNTSGLGGYVDFAHDYAYTGSYTAKYILMNGTSAVDSLTFTIDFRRCEDISVHFYYDDNSNCLFDTGTDLHNYAALGIAVDSNGTVIDTLSATGGLHYRAYGDPGDIYGFRVISHVAGLAVACPSTGIVYDTLAGTYSVRPVHEVGLSCSGTPGFDVGIHVCSRARSFRFDAHIIATNLGCIPASPVVTVITPKYEYFYTTGTLAPSLITGAEVTWNLPSMVLGAAPVNIHFTATAPGAPYLRGDTASSIYIINPTTGDSDPLNNVVDRLDTVGSSFDPNYIAVSPDGCIPLGATELEYTIGFENTGNDTAHNIFVMDTISTSLDFNSFKIVTASAYMNVTKVRTGGFNILKFDFPNIMLPDSSHHGMCHGLFMYTIKTKATLATGTIIPNRVGIYFDENDVVMTNTATNIVDCPVLAVANVQATNTPTVYPNPAATELTITTDATAYTTYIISNSIGQTVMQHPLTATHTRVNIAALPAGIYHLQLKGEGAGKMLKFVKI